MGFKSDPGRLSLPRDSDSSQPTINQTSHDGPVKGESEVAEEGDRGESGGFIASKGKFCLGGKASLVGKSKIKYI